MRQQLIDAFREYVNDNDDPTTRPRLLSASGPLPAVSDPQRLEWLMLRAIREHEQEIRELRQRVTALEAKVGP